MVYHLSCRFFIGITDREEVYMVDVKGKWALITGAARGIGYLSALFMADQGWCRTDLGGQHAPNAPESTIPGIVVGVFVDDKKSGRNLGAQNFAGMTLEDAVRKAEAEFDSPY